ncbi:MAG TPA: beta-ketoacyl-ACP synthase II [Firmicutes bacterium]|nr:beta-ketoacyl-ACP synthase II [Bacillota bacterium]
MSRRVVITGIGVVSPIGIGRQAYFDALSRGKNGIDRVTSFDASPFRTQMAGEVKGFDPEAYMGPREAYRMDRFAQFAVASARQAVEDAGLTISPELRDRAGVVMGCGIGGIRTLEEQAKGLHVEGPRRVSPFFVPMMISNMSSGQVAISLNLRGPNITLTTACAASTHAIGEAFRIIARGEADVMIAGGTEAAVTPLGFAGFCALRAMSRRNDDPTRAMRPFDKDRDGFVMGEGAGAIVMESLEHALSRNANIYAEMAGYGQTCDAHHIVEPDPTGEQPARAMALALRDAGLTPTDVDYINAHGTSTVLNDRCETLAIKRVFGSHAYKLKVSSTKGMTGHLLGAAGAVEAIACVFAIATGIVPPTINYETPDPELDLDYVPNSAVKADVRVAMSNSFGFGGHNAVIVMKRFEP